MKQTDVFVELSLARIAAEAKHGPDHNDWNFYPEQGLTVLIEEVGEVARAILEDDDLALRAELIDVGQVILAWLEGLDG